MSHMQIIASIVAAILAFILGKFWYSPKVFGNHWLLAAHTTEEAAHNPHRLFVYISAFIFFVISALAFALLLGEHAGLIRGIKVSLIVGIGFVTTSLGTNYFFANRSVKLWLIDSGYHIAQFIIYGIVLSIL